MASGHDPLHAGRRGLRRPSFLIAGAPGILSVLLCGSALEGADWHVDSAVCPAVGMGTVAEPFCSIQDGVDAAVSGETVWVAAGIYDQKSLRIIEVDGLGGTLEAILFLQDGVQVVGSGMGASILDAAGSSTVVVSDQCGPSTILSAVTLRAGGVGSAGSFDFGDGLLVNQGSPHLADVEIESGDGGLAAIDILGPGTPIFDRVLIHDNGQTLPLQAAVWISNAAWPTLRSCSIWDNVGTEAGGLLVDFAEATVLNSIVAVNLGEKGGGIRMIGSTSSLIANSTIVANTSAAAGAGIRLESSSPRITGSLVVSNRSLLAQTGGIEIDGGSQPIIDHNDVFANLETDYQSRLDPTGTNGNFSRDPMFRDFSALDLRLRIGSPAIDRGPPDAPDEDISGTRRPLDGDRDGTVVADVGAYESDRWEVRGVKASTQPFRLVWFAIPESTGYHTYRGAVSALSAGDYGICQTLAGDPVFTQFEDPDAPEIGNAWVYFVTAIVDGLEGTIGFDLQGLERIQQVGELCQ